MNQRALISRIIAVLIVGITLCPCFVQNASAGNTIYFKKDQQGVYHFTNRRKSTSDYRVFMVFRKIMRNIPNMTPKKVLALAKKYSRKHGVDHRLIQAVIQVESGYQPKAVSSAGAEGLMQIMPATQKDLGVTDAFDPNQNVEAGVRYLKMMLKRFKRLDLALAAYNAGPGNVDKYKGIPPFDETRNYVKKVTALYRNFKARS